MKTPLPPKKIFFYLNFSYLFDEGWCSITPFNIQTLRLDICTPGTWHWWWITPRHWQLQQILPYASFSSVYFVYLFLCCKKFFLLRYYYYYDYSTSSFSASNRARGADTDEAPIISKSASVDINVRAAIIFHRSTIRFRSRSRPRFPFFFPWLTFRYRHVLMCWFRSRSRSRCDFLLFRRWL